MGIVSGILPRNSPDEAADRHRRGNRTVVHFGNAPAEVATDRILFAQTLAGLTIAPGGVESTVFLKAVQARSSGESRSNLNPLACLFAGLVVGGWLSNGRVA